MKAIVLMLVLLPNLALSLDDSPIIDEELFNQIRTKYSGEWDMDLNNFAGQLRSEELKDGSILIDASGDVAKLMFYYMPRASEIVQYIPRNPDVGYGDPGRLNYFTRIGHAIACGFHSKDLRLDPFELFKCRFMISKSGIVSNFLDRNDSNSNEEWFFVPFLMDFYRDRPARQAASGVADVQHGKPLRPVIEIKGAIADSVFDNLEIAEERKTVCMGPFGCENWIEKVSNEIECRRAIPEQQTTCRINFDQAGNVEPIERNIDDEDNGTGPLRN